MRYTSTGIGPDPPRTVNLHKCVVRFILDPVEAYDFERVSNTAFGAVFGRGAFTDIPFASEILSYLKQRSLAPPDDFVQLVRQRAPMFEARFKAVSRILAQGQAAQILELASGFSTRALDPAFHDAVYVEVDLPKMIARKREMVTALLGSIPAHLHFCSASVLNRDELAQSLTHFSHQPVAITSEGLLRYLTFEEKARLAENVKEILCTYGGVWITPDIQVKEWAPGRDRSLALDLGRDIEGNYFDDQSHARSFFESCGFRVEERPLLEGIRERVVSLPHASPNLLAELESRRIYTMTCG